MADENLTLAQDITENDYPMQHAGEEIDEILSRAGKIHYGTVEHKMTGVNALMRIPLGLNFVPKQVIATLRQTDAPTPYKTFCTHVSGSGKSYYLNVCMGANNGSTVENVPTGTYYVDYIAIE
jgi:hypothetical protein